MFLGYCTVELCSSVKRVFLSVKKGLCISFVSDARKAGFVANLGVAFVDDWVFSVDRVVGNEKG